MLRKFLWHELEDLVSPHLFLNLSNNIYVNWEKTVLTTPFLRHAESSIVRHSRRTRLMSVLVRFEIIAFVNKLIQHFL